MAVELAFERKFSFWGNKLPLTTQNEWTNFTGSNDYLIDFQSALIASTMVVVLTVPECQFRHVLTTTEGGYWRSTTLFAKPLKTRSQNLWRSLVHQVYQGHCCFRQILFSWEFCHMRDWRAAAKQTPIILFSFQVGEISHKNKTRLMELSIWDNMLCFSHQ